MMALRMVRFILSVSLLLLSYGVFAQDQHFVYIQTENSQPFYVRLNGKVFSSTSGGYVILPKLASGNYQLFAGFPKNEFPEQEFHVTIDKVNEGYLLKKLGDGWSLFNIETMALTAGVTTAPVQPEKKTTTTVQDPFATLLADAVRDSSILESDIKPTVTENKITNPDTVKAIITTITELPKDTAKTAIVTSTELPADSAKSAISKISELPHDTIAIENTMVMTDSTKSANTIAQVPAVNQEITSDTAIASIVSKPADQSSTSVVNPEQTRKNSVRRILLVNEKDGLDLVYVDHSLKDTIRIFLPVSPNNIDLKPKAKVIYNPPVRDTAALTITPTIIPDSVIPDKKKDKKPEARIIYETPVRDTVAQKIKPVTIPVEDQKTEEQKIEDKTIPEVVDSTAPAPKKDTAEVVKMSSDQDPSQVIYSSGLNSDCKNFATDRDFLKLRKRMAAETDDDRMIEVARKYFKNKCFSTEQIRNLSYLFLDEEGKYNFFDAAYPFTADTYNYSLLESQLKDPYYINRFKALIHK